jgi:hypothetical protein
VYELVQTEPQWGDYMAISRTAVLLLLAPVPVATTVYLTTSMEDVNASGQCLPSAEAVRQQYPGSWASWTRHDPQHKGERCWFPVTRENKSHRVEAALRRAAKKLMHQEEPHQSGAQAGSGKAERVGTGDTPVAQTTEMKLLGWTFPTRSAEVSPVAASEAQQSSFEDRFAAAGTDTSVRKPSVIQRMMDPVGAIPKIP